MLKHFTGTYDHKMDDKGRVSLPADFRAELPAEGARVVYVYPSPRGGALEACDRAFMEQLRDAAGINPYEDADADLGSLIEEALPVTIDTGGRIMIPSDFDEFTDLGNEIVFVGRGHRFLIMSTAVHAEYRKRRREQMKARAKQRAGDGT